MNARRVLAPVVGVLAAFGLLVPSTSLAARTVAPQPSLDISKLPFEPVGFFKPGDPIPATADPPKFTEGGLFNPSGHWSAYDSNVFESLNFPTRQADDKSASDPLGNEGQPYGFCPQGGVDEGGSDPQFFGAGRCRNHQLEYLDYYERTMKAILGDFGVVVHRYEFQSPGSTNNAGVRSAAGNNGAGTSTAPGRSFNISAEVPGADNPEETVLVSGHYDFTDSGPAAAWDSSEGHTEVIRMAKMMADYWRATGTRPSATVKFIPWDQEETGTVGSLDYVTNNVPPGAEDEIRGYFNVDPCAGGFPAFYHGDGNPGSRVNQVLQLASPDGQVRPGDKAEFTDFNKQSEGIIDQVFDRIDGQTVQTAAGDQPVFITDAESKRAGDPDFGKTPDRGDVVTALGGLLIFSSDYRNFEAIGVPFFNLAPDMFGPHADPTTDSPTTNSEGVAILHTPNDNLLTLNRLTGPDQTGATASDGWMKGMEECAAIEAWGMLQPNMGGAQTINSDPVAYYTALPNEALVNQDVTFDGAGSYEYAATGTRALLPDDALDYRWDFGDGTTGRGRTAKHAYADVGKYETTLTLVNKVSGQSDTMSVPVTVVSSSFTPPVLEKLEPKNDGGTFPLKWSFETSRAGFKGFAIEETDDYRTTFTDDAEQLPDVKWTPNKPQDPKIQPWQRSDTPTQKFRGNQAHGGKTSYWTGTSPSDFPPPEGGVVQGDSILTSKESIDIPLKGSTTLQYWSLFQNEGDDTGRVEVAIDDGNPATPLDWQPVNVEQAVNTAAGQQDDLVCDPSQPATQSAGFHPVLVPLEQFHGRKVFVRFDMHYGAENRALSQPCGWYIDDISVTTGDFYEIGQTTGKTYTVTQAPTGVDAYRIKGIFNDGVRTAGSNIEQVTVTNGGPKRRPVGTGSTTDNTTPGVITCAVTAGFEQAGARIQRGKVRFDFSRRSGAGNASVDVYRVSRGRRITRRTPRVAHFANKEIAFTWSGRDARGKALGSGWYVARISAKAGSQTDVRRVALERRGGRWRVRAAFTRAGCGLIGSLAARSPVFGGSARTPLRGSYRLTGGARVSVSLLRGKRTVRRYKARARKAGHSYSLRVRAGHLRRGAYKLRIVARRGKSRTTSTVTVTRL